MEPLGIRLKRAREERKLTLRQIAVETKISVSTLEALERGDYSRMPGGIFGRAFVRAYALHVGLGHPRGGDDVARHRRRDDVGLHQDQAGAGLLLGRGQQAAVGGLVLLQGNGRVEPGRLGRSAAARHDFAAADRGASR